MKVNIVFDGPPGPESGRFVETEDVNGNGIGAGEWMPYPSDSPALADWWVLQIEVPDGLVTR